MLTYTVVQKTKPLLYFQMTSTNTDQYTQILVHRIRSESSMFTCVIASFNETGYQRRLILEQLSEDVTGVRFFNHNVYYGIITTCVYL